MGDEMTAERKAIEEARWKRGESHLCLGCGRLPPHQGCAAICPACTPPNGTCDCAGCSLASAQALKAIGERDEARRTCDSSALVINDCTARLAAAESALASAREQALEEAALRIETVCTDGLLWVVKAIRSLKATAPTGGSK
jgi:hypothetical protein